MPKSDLREFGIRTMYDRPLILQHTLQDFIFMKPKGRYEMLSAMLGLEPLMTFRTTVESGKTEFNKRIPIREGVFNVIRGKNAGLLRRGYNYGALGREITPATPTPSIRTLYVGVSTLQDQR